MEKNILKRFIFVIVIYLGIIALMTVLDSSFNQDMNAFTQIANKISEITYRIVTRDPIILGLIGFMVVMSASIDEDFKKIGKNLKEAKKLAESIKI